VLQNRGGIITVVILTDRVELLKVALVSHLEHAFDGLPDVPPADNLPVTAHRIAVREAEAFLAFLKKPQSSAVHTYASNQAAVGMPVGLMFRLYEGLRAFCRDALDQDMSRAANPLIEAYCNAYAYGYAEGSSRGTATTPAPHTGSAPGDAQAGHSWLGMAFEISRVVGSILNPDELLNEATDLIRQYAGCSSAALLVIDDSGEWAVVQALSAEPGSVNYPPDYCWEVGDNSLVGQCLATGLSQIMSDADQTLSPSGVDHLAGIRSMLVLPLISHGQTIGAVSFHSEQVVVFDANDQMRLRLAVDQIANAIENARLYRELAAYADTLETIVQARMQEVRQAKEYTEAILNNSPDAILFLNTDGSIRTVNSAFCRLFRCESNELPDVVVSALASADHKNMVERMFQAVLTTGQVTRFRMVATRQDGTTFDLDAAFAPSIENGSVNGVVCNLRDVTDLARADNLVKASLREKEVLLQEIHHRVKNNLQIVASLLNLQMSVISDNVARQALRESQSRIYTMALIHERLYRSGDLASVDFVQYVRDLVNYVARSYLWLSGRITVSVDAPAISLDLSSAIPCGLIINELVSNAFKHAFPDLPTGEIRVEVRAQEPGQHVLTVRDNGVGFPQGFDPASTATLGFQLVQSLVKQLQGTLRIQSDSGTTTVAIYFPMTTAESSSLKDGTYSI